ncbi:MAG: M20 family metallopeptidase [Cyanobacteria bacterium P01_C01_bin.89]
MASLQFPVTSSSSAVLAEIKDIVARLNPRFLEIRRHLHAHPELSGKEYQTAAYVAGVLSAAGIPVKEGIGKTGLTAEIQSDRDRPLLGIRTDMDALPIQERTRVVFDSVFSGIMHACGHDIHTTVGLGTAMVLAQLQAEIPCNARFLFQPAEEIAKGAQWMVDENTMDDVDGIFSLHVFPSIPGGSIGIRYGALTAAADDLEIIIEGESGHGARPHEAIDAIWIAAQVITTLQQSISRTHNPLRPVVLTFGQIEGGRAPNIIADRVRLVGTVRSLHPETTATLPQWITNIATQICQIYGARCQVNYDVCVPSVQNDPALTQILERSARQALGDAQIEILPDPSLGAEDFAVYLNQAPGSMFRLGVGWSDRPNYPLHHPKFDPDEQAIATGIITLAYAAYNYWQFYGPEQSSP